MGPYPLDGEMGPYPLDGEMGPYPLDGEMGPYPLDGEMGPYPLSDGTNLLGPTSSTNLPIYRNYGSNYSTNYQSYGSNSKYVNNYEQNQSNHRTNSGNQHGSHFVSHGSHGSHGSHHGSSYGQRQYGKNFTPVPIRKSQSKRDSFRRHSAHGRIASPSGTVASFVEFCVKPFTKKQRYF